ncbi:acetate--CoA ligase family protein [Anderseniella sp. Alg231-50]|uniref:acetate--CoA ligase family protein n=1 Tax=Anderseniella sp. Alg231-50 TaxID=1922226 RepID=UPI000D5590DF
MGSQSLDRLLSPRSVAVVGGRVAESVIGELLKLGFTGDIWPVNPKRDNMAGLACFPSLEDLPSVPDAAYIGVSREPAIAAVRTLRALGAGGAVCHAAGFSELGDGGTPLNDALIEAAGDMPVIGPNCWGVLNLLDRTALWPDFHGCEPVERGVAILSQSGNMAINFTMQARALPLAMVITVGNQTVTDINDMIEALLDDERITAIGIHTEGIADVARFSDIACKAHAKDKPIVALKTGASEKGARATISHTATLAGSDRFYDALLARTGVARARSVPAFIETLKLLSVAGHLPSGRITSLSCSGGEASLMADAVEQRSHLSLPDLSPGETASVRATLNEFVDVANPLDYHTFIWADFDAMKQTYAAMMRVDADMACLIYDIPRADRADTAQYDIGLDAWIAAKQETGSAACVIATLPECLPEATATRLREAGITPLFGLDEALDAMNAAAATAACTPHPLPSPEVMTSQAGILTEHASKAMLAQAGLRIPDAISCAISEAGSAAGGIGFPVALKASGVAHKTEAGGVTLNLETSQQVQTAADAMSAITSDVLVEEMITDAVCELIVGITRDPQFGLALVIGAGGVLTELLEDSAIILLPASRADIATALASLKVSRLIDGYRGKAGDLAGTLEAIETVARFATDNATTLEELDINPLMVLAPGKGAVAADALIRIRQI